MTGVGKPRVAIVTGGTRGLGRALCLELGGRGDRVVAVYGSNTEAAAALEAEFDRRGITGKVVRHDVTAPGLAAKVYAAYGQLETAEFVLVNNACAPFHPKPIQLVDWAEFQCNWEVSVGGAFLSTQALLRILANAPNATVVNVVSAALAAPMPKGFAAYVSAKAGLQALTQAFAVEHSARGIRFFCVSPGLMHTSLNENWDHRLLNAMGGDHARDPEVVARSIRALIDDSAVQGLGETHAV